MSWHPTRGEQLTIDLRRMHEFGFKQVHLYTRHEMQYMTNQSDARALAFHLGCARRHMEEARAIAKDNKVICKLALTPEWIKHAKAREVTAGTLLDKREGTHE